MHNNYPIGQYHNVSFRAKPIPQDVADNTKATLLNKKVKTVNIYCHSSADEDTMNSAKVYANWLLRNGKNVNICVKPKEITDLYTKNCTAPINITHKKADKVVILDFNGKDRISEDYSNDILEYSPENIIGFDHHNTTEHKIDGNVYIDTTAKSNCSILTRFFEGIGEKINKKDAKSLYCGMISDYKKSGLVKLNKVDGKYTLVKTDKLYDDKNSLEVMNKLEKKLSNKDKAEIYEHLDPLSRLNNDEKKLRSNLFSNIKVSPNGKLAYVIIEPDDPLWQKLGMDNQTTSAIMKDLRYRTSVESQKMPEYSDKQKEQLKNVDSVLAFYRKSDSPNSEYRMSIHSNSNSALKLIDYVKNINPLFGGNGHEDRAGGCIHSLDKDDVKQLTNDFVQASEILD